MKVGFDVGRRGKAALGVPLLALVSACNIGSGGGPTGFSDNVTIVLNVPVNALPWVANFTKQGAQLAADEINRAGGVKVGGKTYGIKLEVKDNQLSPTMSLANINAAVTEKAVAVIDDGYTVATTSDAADKAGLPILVDY